MEHIALSDRLPNFTAVLTERFEHALETVLDSIADVNTKADAVRQITLTVKIKPTNDRSAAAVEISSGEKLAGVAPFPLTMYIATVQGKKTAFEHNINQADLFDRDTSEVVEFGK